MRFFQSWGLGLGQYMGLVYFYFTIYIFMHHVCFFCKCNLLTQLIQRYLIMNTFSLKFKPLLQIQSLLITSWKQEKNKRSKIIDLKSKTARTAHQARRLDELQVSTKIKKCYLSVLSKKEPKERKKYSIFFDKEKRIKIPMLQDDFDAYKQKIRLFTVILIRLISMVLKTLVSLFVAGALVGTECWSGNYNSLVGDYNRVNGNFNDLIGSYNGIRGNNNAAYGNFNQIRGNNNAAIGSQNIASGNFNGIIGNANAAVGSYNAAVGNKNVIYGNANGVFGNSNGVVGNANQVSGSSNLVFGSRNEVW